jgi:molecular chaperone DnaK
VSVVGIDLGTTNTVVGCVRTGKVHVLADEKGVRLLPSVVSFHPNGEVLVGGAAKARRIIDAKHTIYSHKRLIGRSWGSPEITQARSRFAFELREGPGQGPLVHARGQDFTLPEISAFVLKRARQIAEVALGTPVERAVITVPAHFNELQRASTKVAGRVSGLEVLRILNEPTAAALAYGLGRTGSERVAVYDFGGGTFDCTLLDLNGNVFEVLATAGDSFLGGDDIDNLIADRMAETFLKQHRQDARQDVQLFERLKTTAEDVKIALSTAESHTVVLKDFGHGTGGATLNFTFTMSRKDFEAMITPLVDRSFKVTQDALALARLAPSSFDKVILVGGSTRVPLIRKRVEAFFGGRGPLMDRVNPDEVVAIGAAIQAAALTEGIRRRSLPAPPGAPNRPSQNDTQDNTQTSELDPSMLKPAFGSEPPSFGFASTVGSTPPDKFAFASTVGSTPPNNNPIQMPPNASVVGGPGVSAARPVPGAAPARRPTNPGVAPGMVPMAGGRPIPGAKPAPAPSPPSQANEDDPSFASFPDLSAAAPFEWFPGQPGQSGPATQKGVGPGSDTRARDPRTFTQTSQVPQHGAAQAKGAPHEAGRGAPPPEAPQHPGFGAIDEPPSLVSTTGASIPSFPSTGRPGIPSPLGSDPTPWRQDDNGGIRGSIPDGPFGAVPDLSLISTTGVSTNRNPEGFGHVSDLSLISNQTATAATDAITHARSQALESGQFSHDSTEAIVHKQGQSPKDQHDHDALIDRADLPAVVARAKPARKPGEVGMTKDGSPSMMGKAPPPVAPQPFGPMEKIDEPPRSRTAALQSPPLTQPPTKRNAPPTEQSPAKAPPQQAPPQQAAAKPARQPQPGAQPGPMPARTAASFAQTAPLGQSPPQRGPGTINPAAAAKRAGPMNSFGPQTAPAPAAAFAAPQMASAPPPPGPPQTAPHDAFLGHASAPPPMQQGFASAPPPQHQGFASAPPPRHQGFASAPPPQHQPFSFGSSPPAMHGAPANYAPPPPPAPAPAPPPPPPVDNPQLFGSFNSAPPPEASQPLDYGAGAFDPTANVPAGSPQITYQAPVLVDVTPRGLVVETAGGYTDTIIPRNAKIPCDRTRRFATGRDMQTSVRVRVAQGESPTFSQNTFLGEVELSGLRPAARGEVTVAVTFEVDADGTLRVRARDVQTGQEARATLQLVGVADESSVVMMINRFAHQPVVGGPTQ